MNNLIRCTRCLLVATRPDTDFVDGVCSACLYHDRQLLIDWGQRKADLMALFARQKPNDSGFDCIVASSGGKDSTAQVLSLLEMGARPMVVTATTCMLTEIGRKNIDNLKRYASTIEVTPNQEVRAKLNRIGLETVGDISWPEHVAIFSTPLRIAATHGIPLVFYGENPQAAYGGPIGSQEAVQMTRRWISEFGGFLGLRPADMIGREGITARDMEEYAFPTDKQLKKSKCEAHFLGQYIGPWDGRENAWLACEHGFTAVKPHPQSWWDFENLDNAMTGIHDYFMWLKYGLSRSCQQMSVDIRTGFISREDGVDLLPAYQGELPAVYAGVRIDEVCRHIGITFPRLLEIMDQFTNREIHPAGRDTGGQNGTRA